MKKILILANHDVGLYNFRMELIERLIREGFEVHFSVPDGSKVSLIEAVGAVFHPTSLNRRGKNPLQDLGLLWFYVRLIRHIRPGVVLTYTAKPNIYGGMACKMLRVPQLANITGLGSELHGNGKAAVLLRHLYRVGLKRAKTVFFQNVRDRDYFTENRLLFNQDTVVLPGSGVNLERFNPLEEKTFSSAGKASFLFISRIMKDKGIEEFLDAACRVKAEYPACTFTILGFHEGDTYKVRIEKLLEEGVLKSVSFSEDTRLQMADADCVVLPSWHEGMSNVLLEASASGLPIITNDIPGCREAVVEGVSGLLCVAKDTASLVDNLERFVRLSSEEKETMGEAGRRLMEERFDRNRVIEAYVEHISKVVR